MRFFLRIIFVAGYWRKNFFHRNFCPPELDGDPFSTRCTNTRSFFRKERVNSTRGSPSNTFPLGNALGVVLLKNNICWFCCQQLLILSKVETIGTTNEIWVYRNKSQKEFFNVSVALIAAIVFAWFEFRSYNSAALGETKIISVSQVCCIFACFVVQHVFWTSLILARRAAAWIVWGAFEHF